MEPNRTRWNPIVNAAVAAADKCSIDEGIARKSPTTRLFQHYFEKDGARPWFIIKRALFDF